MPTPSACKCTACNVLGHRAAGAMKPTRVDRVFATDPCRLRQGTADRFRQYPHITSPISRSISLSFECCRDIRNHSKSAFILGLLSARSSKRERFNGHQRQFGPLLRKVKPRRNRHVERIGAMMTHRSLWAASSSRVGMRALTGRSPQCPSAPPEISTAPRSSREFDCAP